MVNRHDEVSDQVERCRSKVNSNRNRWISLLALYIYIFLVLLGIFFLSIQFNFYPFVFHKCWIMSRHELQMWDAVLSSLPSMVQERPPSSVKTVLSVKECCLMSPLLHVCDLTICLKTLESLVLEKERSGTQRGIRPSLELARVRCILAIMAFSSFWNKQRQQGEVADRQMTKLHFHWG